MDCSFLQLTGRGERRIMDKMRALFWCSILMMSMAFPVNVSARADSSFGKSSNLADSFPEKSTGGAPGTAKATTGSFETSSSCKICHENIYEQFRESMHAKSYSNPLFRKTYFDVLLKRYADDETLAEEKKGCIACHSPVTAIGTGGEIFLYDQVDPASSGVECDLCHRIRGFKGPEAGNGNYIAEPGAQKFGPFAKDTDWHHVYAELQTKSEVCAICHNRVNRNGLEIISTFSEWKESRYAKEGIQCQDCHMNANGFLTAGKPVFESGRASQNTLARSPARSKIYTHRFPGAHSETQVQGAIELDIRVEKTGLCPGEKAVIQVLVDNSKSGHKLPTGTAELRLVYLDLHVQAGNRIIPVPATSSDAEMFDVSGSSKYDAEFLGKDFPPGRRLYRAVCADSSGRQTYYAYDAHKIVFDNRLAADEIRKEFFTFPIPEDIGKEFSLIAKLYYLRYPDPFAEKLGVEKAKGVELAAVSKAIVLGGVAE